MWNDDRGLNSPVYECSYMQRMLVELGDVFCSGFYSLPIVGSLTPKC